MLVKKLTHSDSSYFERYHRRTGMKQKAINLDKMKMNDLFPSLSEAENQAGFQVEVIAFIGSKPGIRDVQRITLSQKNWRLNGLLPGNADPTPEVDIVLCQILGDDAPSERRIPTKVAMAVIGPDDVGYNWLSEQLRVAGHRGFVNIDDSDLLYLPDLKPSDVIWRLMDELSRGVPADLAAAVDAVDPWVRKTLSMQSVERTGSTASAIEELRKYLAAVGYVGEVLVDSMLEASVGSSGSYEWMSDRNATAPVDFRVSDSMGQVLLGVEVKSTRKEHGAEFFVSRWELLEARRLPQHQFWRVSELKLAEEGICGVVRKADSGVVVDEVLNWLGTAPRGVGVDQVSVSPDRLDWSDPTVEHCSATRASNIEAFLNPRIQAD